MLAPEDLEGVSTAELLTELKRRHHVLSRPPARIALLGPPCVGKSTQAEAFRRGFGVCRISADEVLKAAAESKGASNDEKVVSVFTDMIKQPQCRRGFVVEGLPQSVPQAQRLQEALEQRGTPLMHTVFFDAAEDVLLERCAGRWVHEPSGRLYHEQTKPPGQEGLDDFTDEKLTPLKMPDEEFRKQADIFRKSSANLREFFSRSGLLKDIDANLSADQVASSLTAIAESRG